MISRFFSKILFAINILFVIFLLLSYLAAIVSPVKIPFLIIFSLAYPYIALINLGFLVFWVIIRKWYFIIPLIALIIGIKNMNANFKILPSKTEQNIAKPNKFKILSYNVRVFGVYNHKNGKKNRNNIFKFIRKEKPEIICFQEYYEGEKVGFTIQDSLTKINKLKFIHKVTQHSSNQEFGIATYSNYPIIKKEVINFPKSYNKAIFSDIKIDKDTVRIFNCHLESIRFSKEDYNFIDSITKPHKDLRIKQAQGVYSRLKNAYEKRTTQINLILHEVKKSPYPVFVCGDFNDPPSSYTYHFFSEYLKDSFVQKGIGKGATFFRTPFSYRIDYILSSKSVYCNSFDVKKVEYSDHYPIVGNYNLINTK